MRLIIIILFCMTSCQQKLPDKQKLVQQYYQIKVNDFLGKKDAVCKKEIKELAENQLDSIIENYVKSQLLDTVNFPKRPSKPFKPEHVIDKVQKFEIKNNNN